MPRAADSVADAQPLGERAVIVRAFGSYSEHLPAAARNQHRFAGGVPERDAVFGDIRERHPSRKVGASRIAFLVHRVLLPLLPRLRRETRAGLASLPACAIAIEHSVEGGR